MSDTNLLLWADQPVVIREDDERPQKETRVWESGVYPIGNGRLGGCTFGEPKRERFQFNQDSLWVGNEHNTGAFQPFGDVYVDLPHEAYDQYRRELDIDRAVHTVCYEAGGVMFTRQSFASRPAQLVVVRFTADQPGALTGRVSMGNIHEVPITTDTHRGDALVMRGDTSNFWYWQWQVEDPKRLMASREFASDKLIVLDFEARLRVLHEGGAVRVDGDAIAFEGCDSLTLLLAADTNYVADRERGWRGEHPHDRLVALLDAAAPRSFDDLLAEHVADYRSMYRRLTVELGDTPDDVAALPTADRVKRYGEQVDAAAPTDDPGLEVLLYQYARYLMISSSAPSEGVLPANLQGIWCIAKRPSWRCDFHTDVNIQMNYWFTLASNVADCFPPLARWIDSIRDVRKEETRQVFGVERGWLMRSENGVFGGSTWFVQKGDSAWLCQNLWDYFAFTQDRAYLERYAYPVMKEISEFWVDHLKELPDGTLVAPDGRSPEHGPVGVDGVTYDQCLCWDLFNNTIEASETLGVDEAFHAKLIEKRDRLLGPQVGKWGQLQEWMEDIDDPQDDHRHINHMIGVYPGRQIHPSTTPTWAEAARVGLVARRDHGPEHPGWSRVWKAALFARLSDGEAAHGELVNAIAKKIFGNLWAVHPPFQIDANFGYAAGVNEMLVQSHLQADGPSAAGDARRTYIVHLLPALPAAWSSGSVTGLRARGGFEIDLTWRDGKLADATVRNLLDTPAACVVKYGDATTNVELASRASQAIAS